jgi:ABC-type dipeptide/oligopeptide/nickel transport system permease subunit
VNDEARKGEVEKQLGGVLWLNAKALGLVLGLLSGLALFIATNWLVIKGGDPVGPHLSLLSQYFIGYRVSFLGSFIGFAYAFAIGAVSGALIGWIYNRIVEVRRSAVLQ